MEFFAAINPSNRALPGPTVEHMTRKCSCFSGVPNLFFNDCLIMPIVGHSLLQLCAEASHRNGLMPTEIP